MLAGTSACGSNDAMAVGNQSFELSRHTRSAARSSAANNRRSGRSAIHPASSMTAGMSNAGSAAASAGPSDAMSTPSASCARRTPSWAVSSLASFAATSWPARSSLTRGARPRLEAPPRVVEVRERRLVCALGHLDFPLERDDGEIRLRRRRRQCRCARRRSRDIAIST